MDSSALLDRPVIADGAVSPKDASTSARSLADVEPHTFRYVRLVRLRVVYDLLKTEDIAWA
jgi:hypothetical protein